MIPANDPDYPLPLSHNASELSGSEKSPRDVEIMKALTFTHPGPHVIMYVINIANGTTWNHQHQIFFNEYKRLFGLDVLRHTLLVFSGLDTLISNDQHRILDEFVRGVPRELKAVFTDTATGSTSRYIGIDNTATGMARHSQVSKLLQRVNAIVTANEGEYLRATHSRLVRPLSTHEAKPVLSFRVMLAGPPGQGKTATGNLLFDCRPFSKGDNDPSTTASFHWDIAQNHPLLVCDSTGFTTDSASEYYHPQIQTGSYDSDASVSENDESDSSDCSDDDDNKQEIKRAMRITSPGPHVFLYFIGISFSSDKLRKAFTFYKRFLGKQVLKNTIIVFTHLDQLQKEGKTIEEHIDSSSVLQGILADVGGRYVTVSNKAIGLSRSSHIQGILQAVSDLVTSNEGQFYRYSTERLKHGSYDISPAMIGTPRMQDEHTPSQSTEDETSKGDASDEQDVTSSKAAVSTERSLSQSTETSKRMLTGMTGDGAKHGNDTAIEQMKTFYESSLEKHKEREEAAREQLRENMAEMERLTVEYRKNLERVREQEVRAYQREIQYEKLIKELKEARANQRTPVQRRHYHPSHDGMQCVELGISRTMTYMGNPCVNMELFLQTDFKDFGMDETAQLVLRGVGDSLEDNETISKISYMKLEDSRIYVSDHDEEGDISGTDVGTGDGSFNQTSY